MPANTPLLGLSDITVTVIDTDAGAFALLLPVTVGNTVIATFKYFPGT